MPSTARQPRWCWSRAAALPSPLEFIPATLLMPVLHWTRAGCIHIPRRGRRGPIGLTQSILVTVPRAGPHGPGKSRPIRYPAGMTCGSRSYSPFLLMTRPLDHRTSHRGRGRSPRPSGRMRVRETTNQSWPSDWHPPKPHCGSPHPPCTGEQTFKPYELATWAAGTLRRFSSTPFWHPGQRGCSLPRTSTSNSRPQEVQEYS